MPGARKSRYGTEPVGMARIRVNVSPNTSSHSTGWMTRVTSSVGSCRIFCTSTRHSVYTRDGSTRQPARAGAGWSRSGAAGWRSSAEPAGCSTGTADIPETSLRLLEVVTGVVPEHVLQRGPGAQPVLQGRRRVQGADPAAVHQGDPL